MVTGAGSPDRVVEGLDNQLLHEIATIGKIDRLVENLPPDKREIFDRIYGYRVEPAEQSRVPVPSDWFTLMTGIQVSDEPPIIVRINHKYLGWETLFNEHRAARPLQTTNGQTVDEYFKKNPPTESVFAYPFQYTPEWPGGRNCGKYWVTAKNAAALDVYSALLIPVADYLDPRKLTEAEVLEDGINLGLTYAQRVLSNDYRARYPVINFNCLPRSGASKNEAHWQVQIGIDNPYKEVGRVQEAASKYLFEFQAPLFEQMDYALRKDPDSFGLDLVHDFGNARALFHLTPIKEKEVLIPSDSVVDMSRAISAIVNFWHSLGVTSFNLSIYPRPLGGWEAGWEGFPRFLARMVERGSENVRNSDIGAMEFFASPVVASDPFKLSRAFGEFRQLLQPRATNAA